MSILDLSENTKDMRGVARKVHAFLPSCIDVKEGDEVKIAECKPISKTVSFVTVEVIKSGV